MHEDLRELFSQNRAWADRREASDPGFFRRLAAQQTPELLWIGCSDSRVPANEIVGLDPGELFVHRNVANLVVHTDLNCLSVIEYAVEVLRVRHIIVCGHYGCGGVTAAVRRTSTGLAAYWFDHVRDVERRSRRELEPLADQAARIDRLCELNVLAQARNVARTRILQDAWASGQAVTVHGWIYGIEDGLLRDLGQTITSPLEPGPS